IIFGAVIDDTLGDEVRVTVIAAGFDGGTPAVKNKDTRRATFVSAGAGAVADASEQQATAPDSPSWTEPEQPATAPIDRTFDDDADDELDVPDFLK
ncbi:MAG TPA: cell division protein FtsZ, partial [Galbitalea sp.]